MQLTKPISLPRLSLGSLPSLGSLRGLGAKKPKTLAGLNIEAGSIGAAEVVSNGTVSVASAALHPLRPGVFHEGEVIDPDGLVGALKELYAEYDLPKRVRLGLGNQRVIVRTLRMPAIESPQEMEAAIRFQAQEQIPMPLEQAVLEHQVVGGVPGEEGGVPQVDVVVIAARRDMISSLVEPLRRAGLEPEGIDLSAFGMIRALAGVAAPAPEPEGAGAGQAQEAVLYCNVGDVLNLAVARGRSCLFTRVSGIGMEGIVGRLAAERDQPPELAEQWLLYVGLDAPLEQLEGDPETLAAARRALQEGTSGLVDELRLSLDYYRALESAVPVGSIVLCGAGSAVRGLPQAMEEQVGLPITAVRPAALGEFEDPLAARLVLPFGLALES